MPPLLEKMNPVSVIQYNNLGKKIVKEDIEKSSKGPNEPLLNRY